MVAFGVAGDYLGRVLAPGMCGLDRPWKLCWSRPLNRLIVVHTKDSRFKLSTMKILQTDESTQDSPSGRLSVPPSRRDSRRPSTALSRQSSQGSRRDVRDRERDSMLSWILKHECFSTSAFCSRKHWVKFFMPHTAHDYDDEQKVFEVLGPELSSTGCVVCPHSWCFPWK